MTWFDALDNLTPAPLFTPAAQPTDWAPEWAGAAPAIEPDLQDRPTADAKTPVDGNPGAWAGDPFEMIEDLQQARAREGEAGLGDLEGMLDRQQARRELSSRFQVVPDTWKGRAHNQVTAEEYERICRTYSDVRLGRGDLTIDTSEMTDEGQRQRYRDGAMRDLANIMMTTSGRKLVMGLSNNVLRDDAGAARRGADGEEVHRHTTIRAQYHDPGGDDFDYTNDGHDEASYETKQAATTPTAGAFDEEAMNARDRRADGRRGEGSDSTIWWSPTAGIEAKPSDVLLAHELQHALHATQGTRAAGDWVTGDSTNPDWGDGGLIPRVANAERQVVGLDYYGAHRGDPAGCTENTYRRERNTLGIGPRLELARSTRPAWW